MFVSLPHGAEFHMKVGFLERQHTELIFMSVFIYSARIPDVLFP